VDVVRKCFDDREKGDFDAAMDALSSDVEWRPLTPEVYRGHEGIRQFFRRWMGTWEDYRVEVEAYLDAGDRVVVLAHERGRGRGSGVQVDEQFGQVWTLRERRAVRVEMFHTHDEALEAAGLLE
jgi:uncharacterized protein